MNTEVLTVFDWLQGMSAVGTLELKRGSYFLAIDKGLSTDLTFELTASAGVIIDVLMWSAAERAYRIFGNRAGFAFLGFDRLDRLAIAETIVFVPELPVLFDERFYDRQFISEEFLVFRAVYFIMSPLFQRNISADKENKPADLLMLFLNDVK